jgi:uncharacterized protein YecT (DUF1311 family)
MRIAILTIAALLVACLASQSARADQPPADDKSEARFCASADTQADMDRCSADVLHAADAELNATYQAVLKKWAAYPAMIEKLRQTQRSWLAYRDADLASRFANADAEGPDRGSAYPAAHNLYSASLERERTARLCEYLRGDAYGERDRAPCADLVRQPLVVPRAP